MADGGKSKEERGGAGGIKRIVDPHWHVWDVRPRPDGRGPNSNLGGIAEICPTYTWKDYKAEWGSLPLKACVHLEAIVGINASSGPLDPHEETEWVVKQEIDIPHSIVPHCPLHEEGALDALKAHKALSDRVVGVRQILNFVEGDAEATYPTIEGEYMLLPRFSEEGIPALASLDMSLDTQLHHTQLSRAADVLSKFPTLPVIINHLGLPPNEPLDGPNIKIWRDGMKALAAASSNVYVKLSGPSADFPGFVFDGEDRRRYGALVREVVEFFGPERCMVASNFPVDHFQSGCTMEQYYEAFSEWLSPFPEADRDRMFAGTAASVYKLPLD